MGVKVNRVELQVSARRPRCGMPWKRDACERTGGRPFSKPEGLKQATSSRGRLKAGGNPGGRNPQARILVAEARSGKDQGGRGRGRPAIEKVTAAIRDGKGDPASYLMQ